MYKVFSDRKRSVTMLYETDSTNNDLKAMIRRSSGPVFAVIAAKRQNSGRGRLGRTFVSPEGGIYFSLSFPLTGKEKNIPFLTLLAGLAVSKATEELTGIKTQIKWPNDIYIGDRKLGGILTELVSGKNLCAVVGIGINLHTREEDFPEEVSRIATSFIREGFASPDEKELVLRITEILEKSVYEDCELWDVSESTVREIKDRSYSLGKAVKYSLGEETIEGVVTDIKNNGVAEITLADGSRREIFCGEIT